MNPNCPNCGETLRLKKMHDEYKDGRSKFWVCPYCSKWNRNLEARLKQLFTDPTGLAREMLSQGRRWRWKAGYDVIR